MPLALVGFVERGDAAHRIGRGPLAKQPIQQAVLAGKAAGVHRHNRGRLRPQLGIQVDPQRHAAGLIELGAQARQLLGQPAIIGLRACGGQERAQIQQPSRVEIGASSIQRRPQLFDTGHIAIELGQPRGDLQQRDVLAPVAGATDVGQLAQLRQHTGDIGDQVGQPQQVVEQILAIADHRRVVAQLGQHARRRSGCGGHRSRARG